jgi:hypothetical protein
LIREICAAVTVLAQSARKLGGPQAGKVSVPPVPGAWGRRLTCDDERPLGRSDSIRDNRAQVRSAQSRRNGCMTLLVLVWAVLLVRARGVRPLALDVNRPGRSRLSRDVELDLDIRPSSHDRQEFLLEPGKVICTWSDNLVISQSSSGRPTWIGHRPDKFDGLLR